MVTSIETLIQQVGKGYEKYDQFGLSQGCMAPVFQLYPEIPHYEWPEDETEIGSYMEELFLKHAKIIDIDDILPGDILLVHMIPFNRLHPGVYIGSNQMVHCIAPDGWEIMRYSRTRIKGVYRVCHKQ